MTGEQREHLRRERSRRVQQRVSQVGRPGYDEVRARVAAAVCDESPYSRGSLNEHIRNIVAVVLDAKTAA